MLFKKIVWGAAAVALCNVAFADAPLADSATQDDAGFYAHVQMGYGFVSDDSSSVTNGSGSTAYAITQSINSDNSNGFVGGLGVGYLFNKYLGLESNFTWFPSFEKDGVSGFVSSSTNLREATQDNKVYAADVMVKGRVPFASKFYGFVGAGAAYVHENSEAAVGTYNGASTPVSDNDFSGISADEATHTFVRPKAAVGVGYNVNEHIAVEVGYSIIVGTGEVTDKAYLPNLNMATVGLSYKF